MRAGSRRVLVGSLRRCGGTPSVAIQSMAHPPTGTNPALHFATSIHSDSSRSKPTVATSYATRRPWISLTKTTTMARTSKR